MTKFKQHEQHVQKKLSLSSTIASGNQFSDPSDGVHHTQAKRRFSLMVDCKDTQGQTYRIDSKFLLEWKKRAIEFGKIFALPLRFERTPGKDTQPTSDWILLELDDFSEILEQAEKIPPTPQRVLTHPQRHAIMFIHDLANRITNPKIRIQALQAMKVIREMHGLTGVDVT
jgi:hypothetical protein